MVVLKIGILTIHGIGGDKENSHIPLIRNIQKSLPKGIYLEVEPVYYYHTMYQNQKDMIERMGNIGMDLTRRFLLQSIGDAGTVGYSTNKYNEAMDAVHSGLVSLKARIGNSPMIVIAKSFGCQIFSCYMWDNQHLYKENSPMDLFVTLGNNIPLFISGLADSQIKTSIHSKWINFWSKKDVLGYPMANVSSCYSFVEDISIPYAIPIVSHNKYKSSKKVVNRICEEILSLSGKI